MSASVQHAWSLTTVVDAPEHNRVPERFAVGLGPERRVDLAQDPMRSGVSKRKVMERRLEPDVEVPKLTPALRGGCHGLTAREVEQVDGAARRVGQHQRFDLLDEDADQLGLLAAEAERDTTPSAVPRRRRRDLTHQEVQMAQVVRVGHCIGA